MTLQQRTPLSRKTALKAKPTSVRRCKVCKAKHESTDLRVEWCSEDCAVTLALKRLEQHKAKEARKRAKLERAAIRERKEKIKTRSDYIKEAQRAFNGYVRLRDQGRLCICCDQPLDLDAVGGGYDCGHYRSVGSAPHLRFDTRNAHAQRKQCNRYGAGRAVDYRLGLIRRLGLVVVEALEADQAPRKHDIDWLKRFIKIFRAKTRRLEKRRGK